MVYLKVSDGSETRKLQVTPGEVSFDQLKEQLAVFFPQTLGDGSSSRDLSLQYRDADGDVITLSSDQELQDALSQVQEGGVWKLFIRNGQRGGTQRSQKSLAEHNKPQKRNCGGNFLFRHLFEPHPVRPFGLFSDVWDDLEQHLELLHQLHSELFTGNKKADKGAEENEKKTTLEANSKSETETATSSSEEQAREEEDPDEVVKSKPQVAANSANKGDSTATNDGGDASDKSSSGEPQWTTRRFVTWEPRLHVGPFGFFHSQLTPVVYKVSFRSAGPTSGNSGCCSSASKGDEETLTKTTLPEEQVAKEEQENQPTTSSPTEAADAATAVH